MNINKSGVLLSGNLHKKLYSLEINDILNHPFNFCQSFPLQIMDHLCRRIQQKKKQGSRETVGGAVNVLLTLRRLLLLVL